jgi:RimJ/RimL family protein N-acetyltransferase
LKKIALEPQDSIKDWVLAQMEYPCWIDDWQYAFGLMEDDEPIGGVIFHDYRVIPNGYEMQMTIAGNRPNWLNKRTIKLAMEIVFNHFKCTRLVVACHSKNLASKQLIEKFGFVQEGCLRERMGGPGEDVLLYSLLRSECKWL